MLKKIFRYIFPIILCSLFSAYPYKLSAQVKTFAGKISNKETNQHIAGATITVISAKSGTSSNSDGTFSLASATNPKIHISHINYVDTTLTLTKHFQNILLSPKSNYLEEVHVRRNNINDVDIRNLVSSVTTIDMTKLSERAELDIGRILEGQVPGLTVNFTGELGSKPAIRIRGNSSFSYQQSANEPLFVLDGVLISSETFMTLSPQDFQTIKVLKDAPATALYGVKAANGVIELSSKKGFNGKAIVSVSMNQGVTLRGARGVEMMDTEEKLRFEERIEMPGAPGYRYSEGYIRQLYANSQTLASELQRGRQFLDSLRQYNTDWFKELIRPNRFQTYNLGVRGGSENSNYYYSTNYSKHGGRIPGNDIKQLTARANLNYKLAKDLHLSINNSFGLSTANTENGMDNDPTSLAFTLNPYETQQSQQLTSYGQRSYSDLINQYKKRTTSKRFGSTLIAHWAILPGLNLSAVSGLDYTLQKTYQRIYSQAYVMRNDKASEKGFISDGDSKELNFTSNIRANYQRQFGLHDIYAGVNADYYQTDTHLVSGSGYGIDDEIESLFGINETLTEQFLHKVGGSKTKEKQLGFGAALGYTYNNLYDVYASLKKDGSSLLPNNKRWNDAWAMGIGWSPSAYAFFKEQQLLTSLKFKASLGYTASMVGINMRDINTTYANSNDFYGSHRLLELQAIPNKTLKPQQTYSRNLAVDMGFLKRMNLLVNVYNNRTKEAIIAVPIASSNGFKNYSKNIGELENKGIEITLNGDLIRSTDWGWNSSLSLSYNENKVKKLYGTDRIYLTEQSVIPSYEVGKPLGIIYGVGNNGIHSITGLPEYIDNQGQVIDISKAMQAEYYRPLGYAIAPYTGFFNHLIRYKNCTLTFNINFSFGGIGKFSNTYVRDQSAAHFNALKGQLDNMWFEVGDENKIYPAKSLPSFINELYQETPNTKNTYKTDFIKLNHIRFSYQVIPKPALRNYLKATHIALQADNLYSYKLEIDRGSFSNMMQPIITLSLNSSF